MGYSTTLQLAQGSHGFTAYGGGWSSSSTRSGQINKLNYEGHSNGTVLTLMELG